MMMSTVNRLEEAFFDYGFLDKLLASVKDGDKLKTCIQCGSCSGSCPAAAGMSVTPRNLWRKIQLGMEEELLTGQSFWQCTSCDLCTLRCPRGIPLASIMTRLREHYTATRGPLEVMNKLGATLSEKKNITGDEPGNRLLWMDNLDLTQGELEELKQRQGGTVLFTGCVSSLFPQVYKIPQSLTNIMLQTNEDFALLGEDEWCCGFPLLGAGMGSDALKENALHNVEAVKRKGGHTVLMTCPTCYYIWKKLYPQLLGSSMDLEVVHYSQYMIKTLYEGKIEFNTEEVKVTYHDPCDLGRKSHVTREPRQLLQSIPGVVLKEMRFHGEQSKCCGGGGNLEMLNPELSLEIAEMRLEEATATGAQYLLTTCQQCKRTLMNAARRKRSRIKVNDLLEFIADRMKRQAGGVRA